jgi:hypothetical protein
MNRNRKLLLIVLSSVLIIILAIGLITQNNKKEQNKITVHTDSITGDTIVDAPNKTPEKNDGLGGPTILGLANIQSLFGDDLAFQSFRDNLLREEYRSHSTIKISKDNIKRAVHTTDGITVIIINYEYYLDNKDTSKYQGVVTYNQSDSHITASFTTPEGVITTRDTYAFGED